jgi:hypothetical protein
MNRAESRLPFAGLPAVSGLGVACREAQADGVPCDHVAANCTDCARAAGTAIPAPARAPAPRVPGDGRVQADA